MRIRDHLTARGQDGFGKWYSNDGRVAFKPKMARVILEKVKTDFTVPLQDWVLSDQLQFKRRGLLVLVRQIYGHHVVQNA